MSASTFEHFNRLLQVARKESLLRYGEMNHGVLGDDNASPQQQFDAMSVTIKSAAHQKKRGQQFGRMAHALHTKFQGILQESLSVSDEHIPGFFTAKKVEVVQLVHDVFQHQPQRKVANDSPANFFRGNDSFESETSLPAYRHSPSYGYSNAADSYASFDREYFRSRRERRVRRERRRSDSRRRQRRRRQHFSYEASEDEYDDPVDQPSTIRTTQQLQIFKEPANKCDIHAYALRSVHNDDRKYHLQNIPSNCSNDISVIEQLQDSDIPHLTPEFFTTLNIETFARLPGKKAISPDQMASLPAECLQSLTIEEVREMRDDVLEKVPPEMLVILPPDVRACKNKPRPEPVSQGEPLKEQPKASLAVPVSLGILGTIAGYAALVLFI